MELELIRTYYPKGTHGRIFYGGCLMLYSIERPRLRETSPRQCGTIHRFGGRGLRKDNYTGVLLFPREDMNWWKDAVPAYAGKSPRVRDNSPPRRARPAVANDAGICWWWICRGESS